MEYEENSKSCISESLKFLDIQQRKYAGKLDALILMDHFMSIEHGLQFLIKILKFSENKDLKLRIQHLVASVKKKLYSLPHNQEDENLMVKLDHAYGELREEMQKVVMKPGTDDYDTLFPEILEKENFLSRTKDFLLEKIRELVTSSCKADNIAPVMEELEELRKKLTSLKHLFDIVELYCQLGPNEEEEKSLAVSNFLDRATCLVYLSFVGNLDGDMLLSLRKNFSLLIEETELEEMCSDLETEDDLEADISLSVLEDDINISLSLLKRQEEYHISTINDPLLKDHIMSLQHGIEFLKWLPKIYIDRDLERRITQLAENVKQKLEKLTYKHADENLNMDVNSAYADLREEMKNLIFNPEKENDGTLSREDFIGKAHLRSNSDFLLEKITTLLTSNCKADQIIPIEEELQSLWKMLTFFKPLDLFVDHNLPWFSDGDNVFTALLTFHQKATCLIYLSYVGKLDIDMLLLLKEIDVCEMYIMILNEALLSRDYLEEELYLLENLILLFKSNINSLDNASLKLYEVLVDIHIFLLRIHPNVLSRKRHLLQPSFEAILMHSLAIISSCYLEDTEVDVSDELNCVLDQIKHINSEALEIKLYYFPRVDDMGFLECFFSYLEDLMKIQEMSIKEEIGALHFEVHSLLSLAKVTNQELSGTSWTDIINMAYQAEYIIDLYLASSSRDLRLISSLSRIIEQLKNIRADVNDAVTLDLSHLGKNLPTQDVAATSKPQVLGTTTQVTDNDALVGLQEEAKIITDFLLEGEKGLDVISLVGMAGVGKTTLALMLYNTPSMGHHFDILAWCTVSQSYQTRALLLTILDQVNYYDKSHRSISDDEALADHFYRSLKKRRYLIVLDDIWDTVSWKYLKRYLPDDRKGSRILITTRNRDIADQIISKVNEIHELSDEMSWELFQKRMLEKETLSDDLLKISKKIVEQCKGLPLSIVIVTGILSDIERSENKWNQIANSVSSIVLSDPQGNCKAILELSYNHLSNHLRSCFLYLASFPEDQEISVNQLINMWIGEGLVMDTKSNKAEEIGKKYVEDLIVKSLVIPSKERSRGGIKAFRLHDLLRDFCLDKAKEKHFFTFLNATDDFQPLQDPRRLIVSMSPGYFELDFNCHSIRSMICFNHMKGDEIEKGIGSCDMVLLKVLKVWEVYYLMSNSFSYLSSLVHLIYLEFGYWNDNSVLPLSISKLQNLQFLILRCRNHVMEVPDFIWDMVKLRHVDITPEASFQVDTNRLENSYFLLENLRSLSKARVSCGDSKWLSKLSGLQRLYCVYVGDGVAMDEATEVDAVVEAADNLGEDDGGDLEMDDDLEEEDDGDLEKDDDDDLEVDGDSLEEDGDGDQEEDDYVEVDDYLEVDDDLEEGDDQEDDDLEEDDDDLEEDDLEVDDDDLDEDDEDLDEDDEDLEDNQFQKLSFNEHLTSLKVENAANLKQRFIRTCHLPIGLRKLSLAKFYLKSNDISNIGKLLKHLEVFKIYSCYVPSGYEWNVDDEDFPKLKVLKLSRLKISKWNASEDSFPSLEQLWVEFCNRLDEIPLDFGSLPQLRLITVRKCAPTVDDSAREIEKQQHEEQNTKMRVRIHHTKW